MGPPVTLFLKALCEVFSKGVDTTRVPRDMGSKQEVQGRLSKGLDTGSSQNCTYISKHAHSLSIEKLEDKCDYKSHMS